MNGPFALVGGILALLFTGTNFNISAGIGSETQKPLAIVIVGGLISATILTLLIFPVVVHKVYKGKQITA